MKFLGKLKRLPDDILEQLLKEYLKKVPWINLLESLHVWIPERILSKSFPGVSLENFEEILGDISGRILKITEIPGRILHEIPGEHPRNNPLLKESYLEIIKFMTIYTLISEEISGRISAGFSSGILKLLMKSPTKFIVAFSGENVGKIIVEILEKKLLEESLLEFFEETLFGNRPGITHGSFEGI